MAFEVSPTAKRPTHHILLSRDSDEVGLILCDGRGRKDDSALRRDSIPRSALKIYQGEQEYSSMEPPWTPVPQSDWSGGRGSDDFDKAANRFLDSWRAHTIREGEIVLGGQDILTYGYRDTKLNFYWPWNDAGANIQLEWFKLQTSGYTYLAIPFTATATSTHFTGIIGRFIGQPPMTATIKICNDNSGNPGSVLTSAIVSANSYEPRISHFFRKYMATTLTPTNTYWIVVTSDGTANNYFEILTEKPQFPNLGKASTDGSNWVSVSNNLFFKTEYNDISHKIWFALYKKALIAVFSYPYGSAPKVFVNGEQSVATGGSTSTLDDTNQSWQTNELKGQIVILVDGTGSNVPVNYRIIASNTGTQLVPISNFEIAPDSTTEYVVVNSEKWTELTGHSMTGAITNILSHANILYMARGDYFSLTRLRRYASSGAWVNEWVTESGNKATFLKAIPDESTGAMEVWKANRSVPAEIATAPTVDGSGSGTVSDLVFGTAITVGDLAERITGLSGFGSDRVRLWVHKEGSLYEIQTDVPVKLQLEEMGAVADPRNGAVNLVHDLYLYFSILNKWQRKTPQQMSQLDDVGPDLDAGLPSERQGDISAAIGFPGRYFLAINAGSTGYSSVLTNSNSGWHEVYRSPIVGAEISNLFIQSIPGDTPDRLWIAVGPDIIWVPLVFNPYSHTTEQYKFFPFCHEAHVITSWFYVNLKDVNKFWWSIKLIAEGLSVNQYIDVDYRTDTNTTWKFLANTFDSQLSQEELFSTLYDISGKRIQLRLRLQSMTNCYSPKLLSTAIECITRVPHKAAITLTFRLVDNDTNLRGDLDQQTKSDRWTQLETWSSSPLPVQLNAIIDTFDNKWAFVEPASVRVVNKIVEEDKETEVCQMSLIMI